MVCPVYIHMHITMIVNRWLGMLCALAGNRLYLDRPSLLTTIVGK